MRFLLRPVLIFCSLLLVASPRGFAQNTFTPRYVDADGEFLWWVAANPTTLVTVGSNGAILTSTDGLTWTRRTAVLNGAPVRDWLVGVAHGQSFTTSGVATVGQQWIAVGENGRILRSLDAVTWTVVPQSVTTQRLNGVVFANSAFPAANALNGLWIAVGEGGTILTSPDGLTWTGRTSGVTGWLRGVATPPGQIVTCGKDGVVLHSLDGINFRACTVDTTVDLEALAIDKSGNAHAAGAAGTLVTALFTQFQQAAQFPNLRPRFSPAIVNATPVSTGTTARLRGLFTVNGALLASGEDGTLISAPSFLGPWKKIATGTTANLVAGVARGDAYILVGGGASGSGSNIVQTDNVYLGRLNNVSTRGFVDSTNRLLIAGLVIQGDKSKRVLLRAAGPALRPLGVTDSASATQLAVFDGSGRPIQANSGWMSGISSTDAQSMRDAFSQVGAFAFANNSADSALVLTLPPGSYTMQVKSTTGGDGVALAEAYDLDTLAPLVSRANNLSTRGFVGTGSQVLIAGLIIDGNSARKILLRAVGPGLIPFAINDALAKPRLTLYQGQTVISTAADLGSSADRSDILAAATATGAFTLTDSDSALLVTLNPGAWTVAVSSSDTSNGTALVEAYVVP